MTVCLADIIADLGGELLGDPGLSVHRLGSLADADSGTLSFLANPRYAAQLHDTSAGCVIVGAAHRDAAAARGATIVTDHPYLYFARVTRWWAARTRPALAPGIHPGAFVDPAARLAPDAHVGAGAVIDADAVIGAGAVVGALSVVGRGAVVGPGTRLAPRVSLLAGCRIGARGIVHSGAVIGADGFGFAPHEGRWEKIEQLGGVRIGDDVEIGANSCIDRGALDDTVVEDGAKIDNLVQIAHNVHIGAHTAIAGCVGIAGSTRIGSHCTIAGGVGIVGHITLADHVHVAANATVTRSILKAGTYGGFFPLADNGTWEKNAAAARQLHALRDRLRQLERTVQALTPEQP